MARAMTSDALRHLRVLDLTRVRAGPTCCRVMADFGADVIKVEAPRGVDPNEDMFGSRMGYDNQNLHRNKRSLTINLKKSSGLDLFMKLVDTADVVVENFRPDVKDRLGINYDALMKRNPRIILASISGFGQDGPYCRRPGFDQIVQGMGGLMSVTGRPGDGPMRAGIAVADSSAGLYAVIGILVALSERQQSGFGQWVHTSLLEAQIALCDFQAALFLVEGKVPSQAGNDHPYATPMGVVAVADGSITIAVAGDGQWRAFCDVIGKPEFVKDPRFATQPARLEHRTELMALLDQIFKGGSAAEWIECLNNAGIPAGPIYKMNEVFADPQVQHLGIARKLRDGECATRLVAQPVNLSRTPASLVSPVPNVGEHTDEILNELGFSCEEIALLHEESIV